MNKKLATFATVGAVLIGLVGQSNVLATTYALPTISSLNPTAAPVGASVTIRGLNFTSTENHVIFERSGGYSGWTEAVASSDGTTLTFVVPAEVRFYCPPGQACIELAEFPLTPADYKISVVNQGGGISNKVEFKVTGSAPRPVPGTGDVKIGVVDRSGNVLVATVEAIETATNNVAAKGETTGGAVVFTLKEGGYQAIAKKDGYEQIERVFFKVAAGSAESVIITMSKKNGEPTPRPVPPKICPFDGLPILKRGIKGYDDYVKKLQEILGVQQTGFFGPQTEQKVKDVEGKYGLPKTGIIDDDIRALFFPCYQLVVTSPNGGESWKAGETYEVRWVIETPLFLRPEAGDLRVREFSRDAVRPEATDSVIKPLSVKLSVDLTQFGKVVYHIGDEQIYGREGVMRWAIPDRIASGAYKVRVGVHETPILFERGDLEKRVYLPQWQGWFWDESDGDFKITNENIQPPPPPNNKLKEQLRRLLELVQEMQKLLLSIIAGL